MSPDENKMSLAVSASPSGAITGVMADYSSSLPHPAILESYEKLIPGAAKDIFEMAKASHAVEVEAKRSLTRKEVATTYFGQFSSFLIMSAGMGAGIYFMSQGKSLEGFGALLTPLGLTAAVLIYKGK